MSDVWIGTCVLSSKDPVGRFWEGGGERVSLRLLMRAETAETFEAALRRSVMAGGALLEKITQVQTIAERYAGRRLSPAMQDAVARADSITPLMVSAPKIIHATYQIQEITWTALAPANDLWALLDGVQWPGLPQVLATSGAEHICLYTTTNAQSLAAAPWLVRLDDAGGNFLGLLQKRPCDSHSGILFKADSTLQHMHKHLRYYTMMPTPIGGEVPQYFRFYDPRVMLDALSALDSHLLAQLLRPLTALILPLSPQSLLPADAQITDPPTVFDLAEDCRDRLALATWLPDTGTRAARRVAIDQTSFDRFGMLQKRRAIGILARQLHDEFGDTFSTGQCLCAAEDAPVAAGKFGMNSLKQVTAMARALLHHGPAFWEHEREAHDLLHRTGRLPWQRKEDLLSWLARMENTRLPMKGNHG
ncbi:DUF4123 domain-containing protein [Sulfitobacter sp. F26204]|uniref:DUF4123 domain-containing protein n=1 Tax=Sulfitobacter sp. F26204 TaxID=2996014 RepID=UPI00225E1D30|nr:DUF4123 domain-containing protein [Sulfitobacter sp. F26204]MCX7561588.1 DUF4123 domain-containing protein [Sulfitobacter sp. F26204]